MKEVSADGKTWTFKIKKGTKFTNGEPVNAEAFIRGWNRVALKKSASDVAYHLGGIAGFEDVQSGKADSLSGLKATDEYTLQVKLSTPDFEFDVKTTHTVVSPGAEDRGRRQERGIQRGPHR